MTQPDEISKVECNHRFVTDSEHPSWACCQKCGATRHASIESAPTPAEARGEVKSVEGDSLSIRCDEIATWWKNGSLPDCANLRAFAETLTHVEASFRLRLATRLTEQSAIENYATLARQLAEARAELYKRTDSVIVTGGVALACSVAVKEAFDLQQAQLAQATARLAAVEEAVNAPLPTDCQTFPDLSTDQRAAKARCAAKRGNSDDAVAMRLCAEACNAYSLKLGEIGGNYARALHRIAELEAALHPKELEQ